MFFSANETFGEWQDRHLKDPNFPADGSCPAEELKVTFQGPPKKCCCYKAPKDGKEKTTPLPKESTTEPTTVETTESLTPSTSSTDEKITPSYEETTTDETTESSTPSTPSTDEPSWLSTVETTESSTPSTPSTTPSYEETTTNETTESSTPLTSSTDEPSWASTPSNNEPSEAPAPEVICPPCFVVGKVINFATRILLKVYENFAAFYVLTTILIFLLFRAKSDFWRMA
jgi:hypothetical protein